MSTYQLFIALCQSIEIRIGQLGFFAFPKGIYVYTDSAKRNIDQRIKRHLAQDKNLHWHIDYFLANEKTKIIRVLKSESGECDVNSETKGKILINRFRSSYCNKKCKSHLKLWKEITTS